MVIGDTSLFAIEYFIETPHDDWLSGNFCYVVQGHRIGTYELPSSITAATTGIEFLLDNSGHRYMPKLLAVSPTEMFHTVHDALYKDDSRSTEVVIADGERFRRFQAIAKGSAICFDGWAAYLVESTTLERFVSNKSKGNHVDLLAVDLPPGLFDSVLRSFVTSIKQVPSRFW
jgi:hypothetical protein